MMEKRGEEYPARSRQAIDDLIDLNRYYNAQLDSDWNRDAADNIAELPGGVLAFCHAAFDIRGTVQLSGKNGTMDSGFAYPGTVERIRISGAGKRIHLLQETRGKADEGDIIGRYSIHYDDGEAVNVDLIYGINIASF